MPPAWTKRDQTEQNEKLLGPKISTSRNQAEGTIQIFIFYVLWCFDILKNHFRLERDCPF